MRNVVRCSCGCEFWANGYTDHVAGAIRSDRPCPHCGGTRFTRLSYPRECETLSARDVGDLEVDIRPSGGGSIVSVSTIMGVRE